MQQKGTSSHDLLQSLVNISEVTSISSEFYIFIHRPILTAVLGTVETAYKTLALVKQKDLEFLIPGDSDIYIDLDIKHYVRGKMISSSGKDVDLTDTTAVANNLLQSLLSQCTVMLNGVPLTQSHEHYNYLAYLQSILTYGTDVASPHLSNSYWYLYSGDMQSCNPTAETHTSATVSYPARPG